MHRNIKYDNLCFGPKSLLNFLVDSSSFHFLSSSSFLLNSTSSSVVILVIFAFLSFYFFMLSSLSATLSLSFLALKQVFCIVDHKTLNGILSSLLTQNCYFKEVIVYKASSSLSSSLSSLSSAK